MAHLACTTHKPLVDMSRDAGDNEVVDMVYLVRDNATDQICLSTPYIDEVKTFFREADDTSVLRYFVTFALRITTYKMVERYRSSVTGRFVDKAFAEANPDTTHQVLIKRPMWRWIQGERLSIALSRLETLFKEERFLDYLEPLFKEEHGEV